MFAYTCAQSACGERRYRVQLEDVRVGPARPGLKLGAPLRWRARDGAAFKLMPLRSPVCQWQRESWFCKFDSESTYPDEWRSRSHGLGEESESHLKHKPLDTNSSRAATGKFTATAKRFLSGYNLKFLGSSLAPGPAAT